MYVLLFGLWLVLCGAVTPEILAVGAGLTALLGLLFFALFGYTPAAEWRCWKRLPFLAAYFVLLLGAVIRSSFGMIRLILDKRVEADPALYLVDSGLSTGFGRFLLANSITLTPGTITVREEEGRFTVHAMTPSMIEGVENGAIARLLRRMEELT